MSLYDQDGLQKNKVKLSEPSAVSGDLPDTCENCAKGKGKKRRHAKSNGTFDESRNKSDMVHSSVNSCKLH